MTEKSTGWKMPLLFCTVIAGLTLIVYQFLPSAAKPELPDILEKRARQTIVDLNDPANRAWKDAILEAASGFQDQAVKDAKLQVVLGNAIQAGKLDIACAGAAMLKTERAREEADARILGAALVSCGNLHFGVCALRGSGEKLMERAKLLIERFSQCEGGLTAPKVDQ